MKKQKVPLNERIVNKLRELGKSNLVSISELAFLLKRNYITTKAACLELLEEKKPRIECIQIKSNNYWRIKEW